MECKVKWRTEYPKKKWTYYKNIFPTRKAAKNWIRNHLPFEETVIEDVQNKES